MPQCVIPGYIEQVELEKEARNLVYLGQPEIVCGERLSNITPLLLAWLTALKSPFLRGGNASVAHCAQFLWCCHSAYEEKDDTGPRRMLEAVARRGLDESISEIGAFMKVTFMDAPTGGPQQTPIASSIAWLIYRFRCEPFRMSREATLRTPLRELYQELRCWTKENGTPVLNPSDKLAEDWMEWLRAEMKAGRVTAEDIQRINAAGAQSRN